MIYTDGEGRPIPEPAREDFETGIEGEIAYMRARWAWKDKIADVANAAFTKQFKTSGC